MEEEKNRKMSVPCLDLNLSQSTITISSLLSLPTSEIGNGKKNNNNNRRTHRRGENITIPKERHDCLQECAILREIIKQVLFDQNGFHCARQSFPGDY